MGPDWRLVRLSRRGYSAPERRVPRRRVSWDANDRGIARLRKCRYAGSLRTRPGAVFSSAQTLRDIGTLGRVPEDRRKGSDPEPSTSAPGMLEGDIAVTRVARHYSVGRVNADRQTQTPIETHGSCADALSRAFALAGPDHQVFLSDHSGTIAYTPVNPGEKGAPAIPHRKRATARKRG